jgi:hypothetical protein
MENASDLGEALIMFWATSEVFVLRGGQLAATPTNWKSTLMNNAIGFSAKMAK